MASSPLYNTVRYNTSAYNAPPAGRFGLTIAGTSSVTVGLQGRVYFALAITGTSAVAVVLKAAPLSAAIIASAMTARYGVSAARFRFEQHDLEGNVIADLSPAVDVQSGSIALDNDRAVARTLSLALDGRKAPAGFLTLPWQQQLIAAYYEVYAGGQWNRFPLGLFYLDRPQQAYGANRLQDWTLSGSDLTIILAAEVTSAPYTVTAGVYHLSAVAAILGRFRLRMNLPAVGATLPVAVTWPAGVTLLAIVNDLLFGVNYYPLWADATGVLTTRARLDPYQEVPAVLYDTTAEPRFIAADKPLTETIELTQFPNVVNVAIDDPLRVPVASRRKNADTASPISTTKLNREILAQLDGSSSPSTKAVLDLPTANAIGAFELKEAATRAVQADLHTVPDPRRGNREFIALNVAGVESYTRWRVAKWSMELRPGGDMAFTLGKVQPVNVS